MKEKLRRVWHKLKIIIRPFLSFRLLLVYLPIYFICTGWTYVCLALPGIDPRVKAAAAAWCAFLWMPFSEEKLVTIPLTIFLYKKIFLNPKRKHNTKDEERIRDLEDMLADIKQGMRENRQRRKEERIARRTQKFIKTKK